MSHWWRAHDESVDDPKLQLLPDAIFRAWFNINCLVSANGGTIPPLAHVAFKLRVTEAKAAKLIEALRAAGLIDALPDGQLQPHNWNGRQFKSDVTDPTNAERQQRYRERQRNGPNTVTPTVTDTVTVTPTREQITDTETERERKNARARASPAFDQFWEIYPHKVGKRAAYKAFETAMKSGAVTLERMLDGLRAYVKKTDDRPWCNPATWLNQGRWDDQPAPGGSQNGRSLLAAADRLIDKFGGMEAANRYVPGSSGPGPLRLDLKGGAPGVRKLSSG